MPCKYCLRYYEHDPRCPLYKENKSTHYCSICGNGIYNGEEFIRNNDCDYAHWECIDGKKDLAEWLNYEIGIMEED